MVGQHPSKLQPSRPGSSSSGVVELELMVEIKKLWLGGGKMALDTNYLHTYLEDN